MDIAKVVHIVASSEKSFDDAVQQGITNVGKTVRGITGVKVTDWTAKVQDNQITQYKVTLDVAFHVEQDS